MTATTLAEQADPRILISYVGDLVTAPPDDVLVVASDEAYVRACDAMTRAARAGRELAIWVRSKAHLTWLRDFVERTGLPAGFREMTARLVLAERWHVSLPDWLDDETVLRDDLLAMDLGPQTHHAAGPRTRFADRLMTHLLGSAFQAEALGADNLAGVLRALTGDQARAAYRDTPVLTLCLNETCERWSKQSSEVWVTDVCRRLQEDAPALWQWLSLWACLHSYPDRLLDYVLTPGQAQFVRRIPVDAVAELPLEPTAREDALAQIEGLFDAVREEITSGEAFRKVVAWTSGRLIREYRLVTDLLEGGAFPPTLEDVQAVRERFRSCPGVSESEMNALDYVVKPGRPSLLEEGGQRTWQEWVQWTIKDYAPYRDWQVRNNAYEEALEKTVSRFSSWFIEAYTALHADPDLSLIHCLRDLSSGRSGASLAIVLLIDCLPVSFMSLMDDALRNVGFSRHSLQYRFAALPTDTAHNKPYLLSGAWQDGPADYPTILAERAAADWGGRQVVYLGNLKALAELQAPQGDAIVVLNFTDGDRVLHSDVESLNSTYEEELHRLFVRIGEAVAKLSAAWVGPRDGISVRVVTDHGACRILEEEKHSLNSAVVSKLFPDEKHRYASVELEQRDTIPESMWALGHSFRQPFISDNRLYFLPKGHNTVRRAARIKGYMHGGVTPEEVIVPTATYRLVKADWRLPAARFLDLRLNRETGRAEFYIQRIVPLRIEIQNPNAVDIEVLRASVTSPDTELKATEVATVPAGGTGVIQVDGYFRKPALEADLLEIEIVYELAGEPYTLALALECEFKSAIQRGFSLRDL